MGFSWWNELSDVELKRRLTQRGFEPDETERLVGGRDYDKECIQFLNGLLGLLP